MSPRGTLRRDREAASVAEARSLIAYNQRILVTTTNGPRRVRAARMLEALQPRLARLMQAEAQPRHPAAAAAIVQADGETYAVVWDGSIR